MIRKPTLWKRFKKRLWKISKWGFGFLGVAILSGYVFVRYDYLTAADELEYQEELARQNGFSLTSEDMRPRPPVKPEDNAAPIYRKMSAAFKEVPKLKDGINEGEVQNAANRPGKLNLQAASAYISRFTDALHLAKKASQKPRCDFGRDWSNPWSVEFPEYSQVKRASNLLSTRAVVRARSGDIEGAASDLRAMFRFVPHLSEEKTVISALVSIALEAIAAKAVQNCSSFLAHDPQGLLQMTAVLNELPQIPDPMPFIKGDVYFGYGTCLQLKAISDQIERERPSDSMAEPEMLFDSHPFGNPTLLVLPPMIESDLCERAYAAKCLKFWNGAFEGMKNDPNPKMNFGSYLDKLSISEENSYRPSDQLNRILFPVFGNIGKSFVKWSFYRQGTKAYIEVLQFRNRTGAFPESLKKASIVSVEPYGKTTFCYRKTDDGFRIYDVGLNGRDDGGLYSHETPKGVSTDDRPILAYPNWTPNGNRSPEEPSESVAKFLAQLNELKAK
jgi:hypothetical protein